MGTKTKQYITFDNPYIGSFCFSYPFFCTVIALSLLCTLKFDCPHGCESQICYTDIPTDDFEPHTGHNHHNMTRKCTCGDNLQCEDQIVATNSLAQLTFGILFAIISLLGFLRNTIYIDFEFFDDGIVNYFVKACQENTRPWKYLRISIILCFLLGLALSFVNIFSIVLLNAAILQSLFAIIVYLRVRKLKATGTSKSRHSLYGYVNELAVWLLSRR